MPGSFVPPSWQLSPTLQNRLGERAGRQRAMAADGQLLLVLHAPRDARHPDGESRLFFRDAQKQWRSTHDGAGPLALKNFLRGIAEQLDALEAKVATAQTADEMYALLRAVAPLHRTTRNMHAALQQARELEPSDRDLIAARDQAGENERAAELLHHDAIHGLDFATARQAEAQARSSQHMAVAAHRLNVLAAVFFPLVTVSTLLGMNVPNGLEQTAPPGPFLAVLGAGLAIGLAVSWLIVRRP